MPVRVERDPRTGKEKIAFSGRALDAVFQIVENARGRPDGRIHTLMVAPPHRNQHGKARNL